MRLHLGLAAAAAGLTLAVGLTVSTAPAGATTPSPNRDTAAKANVIGTGHAVARSVTVSQARQRDRRLGLTGTHARPQGPLGRDGRLAGAALAVRATLGARMRPAGPSGITGLNQGRSAWTKAANSRISAARPVRVRRPDAVQPASVDPSDFTGLSESGSNGGGPTPDVTAAVSGNELAETVNLTLQVFSKSTAATDCTVSLASLLGATTSLSHPRIQWDNANNRFSLVVDSVPSSAFDVPIQYLAASQTSDACGAWWIYSLSFPISSTYPLGATLNYPYLGQDRTSILSSTNNYNSSGSYVGSSAYAIPKSAAYSGAGFSFTTYSVAFSTAPVTVAGIPVFATTTTYWLASVPGTGYDLYSMPTNPAGAITLRATIRAPFSAPSRRVNQPGTSVTLDPLDGRIQSAPVQDGNVVWFTHDINYQGFPTVLYGGIDVNTDQIETAVAFDSNTSDDFNPSIAVTDAGNNTNFIWVDWSYTDSGYGVPVSDTVAGVAPGQGVPDLAGADLTLVTGSSTSSISTFGSYSSAEVDSFAQGSCPAGETALTAQEYFTGSGSWATQLARTTFC
ncbi:MAG TPA: hypothetical protein VKS82_25875 [Streptosporangiaceae bacterium]|jgi:hypothetical protein|nr:hypothetical protein [Streptosporangiaceae bacterium]